MWVVLSKRMPLHPPSGAELQLPDFNALIAPTAAIREYVSDHAAKSRECNKERTTLMPWCFIDVLLLSPAYAEILLSSLILLDPLYHNHLLAWLCDIAAKNSLGSAVDRSFSDRTQWTDVLRPTYHKCICCWYAMILYKERTSNADPDFLPLSLLRSSICSMPLAMLAFWCVNQFFSCVYATYELHLLCNTFRFTFCSCSDSTLIHHGFLTGSREWASPGNPRL